MSEKEKLDFIDWSKLSWLEKMIIAISCPGIALVAIWREGRER